jgi:hypothetical protein
MSRIRQLHLLGPAPGKLILRKIKLMMAVAFAVLAYVRAFLVSRHRLALEVVALRQQLAVWKRKPPRPKLKRLDRLF